MFTHCLSVDSTWKGILFAIQFTFLAANVTYVNAQQESGAIAYIDVTIDWDRIADANYDNRTVTVRLTDPSGIQYTRTWIYVISLYNLMRTPIIVFRVSLPVRTSWKYF